MSTTTRLQIGEGNNSSFSFEQLPTPTRHLHKQAFEGEPIFDKVEEDQSTTWCDPLSHFGSSFDTPLKTHRDEKWCMFCYESEREKLLLR